MIAVGVFVATLAFGHAHRGGRALDLLGVVLAAIACFALLGWRRWRVAVFVLSAVALWGGARANGLQSEIQIEGEKRALAPALDQAAYRILQESLTNAARYGDRTAEVRIGYGDQMLELTVSNGITDPAANGVGGHGILGMRERAELLGGTLTASPSAGRFLVRATLPY